MQTMIAIRLDQYLYSRFKRTCKERGQSISAVVRMLMQYYFEHPEKFIK